MVLTIGDCDGFKTRLAGVSEALDLRGLSMGLSESFCYGRALNPIECNAQLKRHGPVFGKRHPMRVVVAAIGLVLLEGQDRRAGWRSDRPVERHRWAY
ncbi:hypothetical protein EMIT0P294_220024 [Pseudomonas sp. IT-P294]